jgi:hypothetical protein
VDYHIANYFGDKSGRHYRSKAYLLLNDQILQRCTNGEFTKISKVTKELKGILSELN